MGTLAKTNKTNLAQKYTNAKLLDIFPEARQIIPALIKEYSQQRSVLVRTIAAEHKLIIANPDENYRYFWTSWLKLTKVQDLWEVDKHIDRLKRFFQPTTDQPLQSGLLSDEQVETARAVPIASLLNQEFRRSSGNLMGLCPFHEERTSSFYVYTKENRGWCFGCHKGGDAIDIVMLTQSLDFRGAVQFLAGGQR